MARAPLRQAQGRLSTRPPSLRSVGFARDGKWNAGEGARATSSKRDVDVFRAFVKAGERLADLHVNYEKQPECPLEKIEKKGEKLDWRVEKMRLNRDKTSIIYNQFLTLSGIPPETFEYRLGNRSAREWVIDQYQVSKDKRSGIRQRPQPRQRRAVHRAPHRPGHYCQPGDDEDREIPTQPQTPGRYSTRRDGRPLLIDRAHPFSNVILRERQPSEMRSERDRRTYAFS